MSLDSKPVVNQQLPTSSFMASSTFLSGSGTTNRNHSPEGYKSNTMKVTMIHNVVGFSGTKPHCIINSNVNPLE